MAVAGVQIRLEDVALIALVYTLGVLTPIAAPSWARERIVGFVRSWTGAAITVAALSYMAYTVLEPTQRLLARGQAMSSALGIDLGELAALQPALVGIGPLSGTGSIAQAFVTAYDLGILHITNGTSRTVEEVASLANVTVPGARCVLRVLAQAGLMDKSDGGKKFSNNWSNKAINFLIVHARFMVVVEFPMVAHLTESVKTGKNMGLARVYGEKFTSLYHARVEVPELVAWSDFMDLSTTITTGPLLSQLSGMYDKVSVLLDVCGNEGINAIKLAHHYPKLRITVHDLPGVINDPERGTRLRIKEAGLEDRLSVFAKDLTDGGAVGWPQRQFDMVQLLHCVNEWSLEELRSRLAELTGVLVPGGSLIILGGFPTDRAGRHSGEVSKVWYHMPYFMAATQSGGTLHSVEVLTEVLAEAGFVEVQWVHLLFTMSAMVARKPLADG